MKTLRLAINGANGRMGQEIMALVKRTGDRFYITATVDEKIGGESFDTHTRMSNLKATKPDVLIDFSSPKGALQIAQWCLENKKPLVIGTTGFTPQERKKFETMSKKIPILISANMSPGVNALAEALKTFSQTYKTCDVSIEEIHHKHKKDKPSGTALMLKAAIEENNKNKHKVQPPLSMRGGEIFGIHKVYFLGTSEYISFEHHAQNRSVFAEGALLAARWICGKSPGLYSMNDIFAKGGEK